ncbi:MAG: peptide deformylase [Patescibacteria group bacterium]|nr:peptide deformylase [Patescibacteria group bacterium]
MDTNSIFLIGDEKEKKVLRTKIPLFDFSRESKKELKDLIKKMRLVMKEANGVGLSANQIGVQKRIFVAQVPNDQGRIKFYVIINPEIKKISKEKIALEEGCLSIPETFGIVPRAEKLVLEGFDINGKKLKIKAWGLLARVFQHEVDHLNGMVFTDHCKEVRKIPENIEIKEIK